jgi:hypothetical protein
MDRNATAPRPHPLCHPATDVSRRAAAPEHRNARYVVHFRVITETLDII